MRVCLCTVVWLLLLSSLLSTVSAQSRSAWVGKTDRRHPYLVLDSTQFALLRQQINDSTWKQQSWKQLKTTADKYLREPLEIPPRGGNWDHYYISPTTEHDLKKGRQIGDWQWEHVDPQTGEVFRGDTAMITKDYDGVVIGFIHDAWAIGVLQLGLAYQLTSEQKYADKARAILLAYADRYKDLPLINKRGVRKHGVGAARVQKQTLNEAIWLMDMAQGTDLIWNTLSEEDRQRVNQKLFYPALEVLLDDDILEDIGNIQCWKNAAIGMVGFLNQDLALIQRAMSDSLEGYNRQVTEGVTKEGFIRLMSPGYHFYSLIALTNLAQAAINYGYPVQLTGLHRMFLAPLLMANSWFMLPSFNDSRLINLRESSQRYLYEWGYAQFKDSVFRHVIYGKNRGEYTNFGAIFTGWGLLYGTPDMFRPGQWLVNRKNFSEAGVGMLSTWQGYDNLALYLKYDTSGSGHVHYDELSFALFKGFEPVGITPSLGRYGSVLVNDWSRTSLSHNTFIMNETEQQKSSGQCLFFGTEGHAHLIMTKTTNAYDSVRFVRSAAMLTENLVLFIDQFQTPLPPQTLDIAYNQAGIWLARPTGHPWAAVPDKKGYRQVRDWQQAPAAKSVTLSTQTKTGRAVSVCAVSLDTMQVLTGYGKPYLNAEVPIMLFRQKTNRTAVAWCISLDGSVPTLELERVIGEKTGEVHEAQAAKVTITLSTGESWQIWVNPDQLLLRDGKLLTEKQLTVEYHK